MRLRLDDVILEPILIVYQPLAYYKNRLRSIYDIAAGSWCCRMTEKKAPNIHVEVIQKTFTLCLEVPMGLLCPRLWPKPAISEMSSDHSSTTSESKLILVQT